MSTVFIHRALFVYLDCPVIIELRYAILFVNGVRPMEILPLSSIWQINNAPTINHTRGAHSVNFYVCVASAHTNSVKLI